MLLTMFLVSVLGALLGLLFLIPLRRYFVAEQHGKLPFPEATAINEVYVTGETGGEQARTLVMAAGIGGIFDFLATTVKAWAEVVNFQFLPFMKPMATDFKATISVNAVSLILGLGYITGLRYSAIICAGSLFSTLILVPLIYHFGQQLPALRSRPRRCPASRALIQDMSASHLFRLYAQRIGVGAMAGAGIIGIIKSLPTIVKAFSLASSRSSAATPTARGRAHRPRPQDEQCQLGILAPLAVGVFFFVPARQDPAAAAKAPQIALTGLLIAFVFSFLFTTVAALATAMTGNNPISGMTLVTLIIGSTALVAVGLDGRLRQVRGHRDGRGRLLGAVHERRLRHRPQGGLLARLDAALPADLQGDRHPVRGGRRGAHRAAHPPRLRPRRPATGQFVSGFINTSGCPRRRRTSSPPSCPASSTSRR